MAVESFMMYDNNNRIPLFIFSIIHFDINSLRTNYILHLFFLTDL